MKAFVNQKACIQCGLCPTLCPAVFSIEPGLPAQAITDEVPENSKIAAKAAAESCPVLAITIK